MGRHQEDSETAKTKVSKLEHIIRVLSLKCHKPPSSLSLADYCGLSQQDKEVIDILHR